MMVILCNTLFMLAKAISDDPTVDNPDSVYSIADEYLLYIYTVEMAVKIMAFGIILNVNGYLRDMWNFLDFVIIVGGWISYFLGKF